MLREKFSYILFVCIRDANIQVNYARLYIKKPLTFALFMSVSFVYRIAY